MAHAGLAVETPAIPSTPSSPQSSAWNWLKSAPESAQLEPAWVRAEASHIAQIDVQALRESIQNAPRQHGMDPAPAGRLTIALPMPDGTTARFAIYRSALMADELADRYPEIMTFAGEGLDDPYATIRMDITPLGFHAQVLSPRGAAYIDPYSAGNDAIYSVYYKRDLQATDRGWSCETHGANDLGITPIGPAPEGPATIRVYRLAVAATGEFSQYYGGTIPGALGGVVTLMNRVTGITEQDLAVRFQLVANNDKIIFLDPNGDPFSNGSAVGMMLQTQSLIDLVIHPWQYDLGHGLASLGGGAAELSSICGSKKAMGVSGFWPPIGDPFAVDYIVHEMGHQLGASHTFNGVGKSCFANTIPNMAFEPGSGSTIMAYAGLCGNFDDLQKHSDPYFHAGSIAEIQNTLLVKGGCAATANEGNNTPVINAGNDFTVPRGTPFELIATGYDPDGNPLTWCWEELDLGPPQPASGVGSGDNGFSPIFRSWNPSSSSTRTLPSKQGVLTNNLSIGEHWPQLNRTLKFRVTARDKKGGVATDDASVNVYAGAGPFSIYQPWNAMGTQGSVVCKWFVAGTNGWPIYATNVNIRCSTDGGQTYPHLVAENVPNSGEQWVWLPNISTTQARLRVESTAKTFYAVSPSFAIQGTGGTCQPDCDQNGVLDISDIICFQINYAQISSYADCDTNSQLNIDDFICFLVNFSIGC